VANDDGCALIPDNQNPNDDIFFDPNDPFTYYQNGVVHHMNPRNKAATYSDMRVGSASPDIYPNPLPQSPDSDVSVLPKPEKAIIDETQQSDMSLSSLIPSDDALPIDIFIKDKAAI